MVRLIRFFVLFSILVITGACTTVTTFDSKVFEPTVDDAYQGALRLFCNAPIDVHVRQLNRDQIIPVLPKICKDWAVVKELLVGT